MYLYGEIREREHDHISFIHDFRDRDKEGRETSRETERQAESEREKQRGKETYRVRQG